MNSTGTASARPKSLLARRLGVTVATVAMAGAATLVAAPSASAAGAASCNHKGPFGGWKTFVGNVNLRNGPGTGYYSKGQLARGTVINIKCTYLKGQQYWYYGQIRTGAHKNAWGWIFHQYAHIA
jgi:uncharacterized protein YraI